ncbi:uncharacterized protein lrrc53 [Synchiropus picturatus]
MTRVLLVLLLSAILVQGVPSCPASCVVCSDRALICHRLTEIIDAPDTIEALLLTEGSISNVQSSSLSDLSSVTLIGLSHNHISVLGEESFSNLTSLHTLLLDHNLLTSETLQRGVLMNLAHLEILALGNNRINMIEADFLKGTETLRTLKLEGNLLTSLDSKSFPYHGLRYLEDLDLSDNLINSISKNSFHGLLGLRLLDLSRNRVASAPAEVFSYLSGLTHLNLEFNSWNCTCHLLELADFLSTFIQQPNKTLHNGRKLACVSADNPALTTVLQLTEANCVPPNQNITVRIESRSSVTPQLYARDVAIAAVICFIGGVSVTLLVVLIWYRASRRRKLKEARQREKDEEESGRSRNHWEAENRTDNLNPMASEALSPESRIKGQYWIREEDKNLSRCSDCRGEGSRMNLSESRRREGIEAKHDPEGRRVTREEGRRRLDAPHHVYSNGLVSSYPAPYGTAVFQRNEMVYRADMLQCESCHQTCRPPEGDRPGFHAPPRLNGNNQDSRRYVSFDLESLKMLEKEPKYSARGSGKSKTSGESERDIETKSKSHSGRSLKVKLNLSPLRKTRVHPKKKSELSDKSNKSPKKSKGSKERAKTEADRKKVKRRSSSKEKPKSVKTPSDRDEAEESRPVAAQSQTQIRAESVMDQAPVSQNQGVGWAPGNWPQHSLGRTTSLSLLRTENHISLPGGNVVLQNMATRGPPPGGTTDLALSGLVPGAPTSSAVPSLLSGGQTNALLPSPTNPLLSSLLLGGLNNMTQPSGSLGGPTAAFVSSPTNSAPGSLLPGGPTSPHVLVPTSIPGSQANIVSTPQTAGSSPNSAAKTPVTQIQTVSQSPLSPDGSALLLKHEQTHGQGLPAEVGPHEGRVEPPASQEQELSGAPAVRESIDQDGNTALMVTGVTGGVVGTDVSTTGVSEVDITPQGKVVDPALLQQEYLSEDGGSSPRRKLRLVLPEKTSARPPTALERKIR